MQCPKCGWRNPDSAAKCNNCFADLAPAPQQQPQPTQQMPQPPQQQPYAQPPQAPYAQQPYAHQPYGQQPYAPGSVQNVPEYLVWSILATLFCCMIPGIVAILKSASANSKRAAGDIYGAMQEARRAGYAVDHDVRL